MTVLASMAEPKGQSSPLVTAVALTALVLILVWIWVRGHLGKTTWRQDPLDSMSEDEFRDYINEIGGD